MKTAAELYLTDNQYSVLLELLRKIEAGEIKDIPEPVPLHEGGPDYAPLDYFDYRTTYSITECGAVGCLLGWARFLDPKQETHGGYIIQYGEFELSPIPPNFSDLCFVNFKHDGRGLTVAEAGKALRSYLETGSGRYVE